MQADETRDFGINDWIAPTLLNSWVNFGSTHEDVAYCKDSNGMVHIRGLVKNGTVGTNAFVLPAGYRPQNDLIFATLSNNAIGRITIDSTGGVELSNIGSNTWYSLNIPPFSVT